MAILKRVLPALLVVLAVSCTTKPKVGDKCENGMRACVDKTQGLYCANGAFQADTCKGPKGCYEEKSIASCDLTGNDNGDPCPAALDGFSVCRADRKTRAMCKAGKYVVETCRGEDGCTTESVGMARCDRGDPEPGEACTSDARLQFCSSDKKSFVTCKDGKYVVRQKCPGPNGCRTMSAGVVACDPFGAFAAGDDCFFIQSVCTADGKSLLACKDGKLAADQDCPGPERCRGGFCDTGVAVAGEICTVGGKACSLDKKTLLECKAPKGSPDGIVGATWSVAKKCKSDCVPKDGQLACD
jgi:hypothetical protein